MSALANFWTSLWHPDAAKDADIAPQIDEELLFHFHALVDENLASGMSSDDAWKKAQQRFGSMDRYAKETWRIDMGTKLLVQRMAIGGMVVLFFLCGWLWIEVERLHAQNQSLTGQYETMKQLQ